MENRDKVEGFVGLWVLIPESCKFDQGAAPIKGSYKVQIVEECVSFTMNWTEKSGKDFCIEFSGVPNGKKVPFNGGALADEMSIIAVSKRELNSYAYLNGKELMVAQRQLDDTGMAMRITQVVRLPDGTNLSNVSIYRRQV